MSWIQLYDSQLFDFNYPSVDNITIETIAHSLSMQCRYNGHCNRFYSVAEHSVLVAKRVFDLTGGDQEATLFALLHDASEAVICDIPRPLKLLPESLWYRELEEEIQMLLMSKFVGYSTETIEKVTTQADFELLATEKEQLMSEEPRDWGYLPEPLSVKVGVWGPEEAKNEFLLLYHQLSNIFAVH